MRANPTNDPVGYVLDVMWCDLTKDGQTSAINEIQMLVASRMYPEALTLAIAVEVDRAKREAVDQMYHGGEHVAYARAQMLATAMRGLTRLGKAEAGPPPKRREPSDG